MSTLDQLLTSPAPFKEWLAESEWVPVDDWFSNNPLARFLREKADVAAGLVMLELPDWAAAFNRAAYPIGDELSRELCILILDEIDGTEAAYIRQVIAQDIAHTLKRYGGEVIGADDEMRQMIADELSRWRED
jgi:hypothetical protein